MHPRPTHSLPTPHPLHTHRPPAAFPTPPASPAPAFLGAVGGCNNALPSAVRATLHSSPDAARACPPLAAASAPLFRAQGTRAQVDAEQRRNKAIGDKTGCWKARAPSYPPVSSLTHLHPTTTSCEREWERGDEVSESSPQAGVLVENDNGDVAKALAAEEAAGAAAEGGA